MCDKCNVSESGESCFDCQRRSGRYYCDVIIDNDRDRAGILGELEIEIYPKHEPRGMSAPMMSKGIKITHLLTGNVAICNHHRNQHKNKAAAIEALQLMLGT